MTSPSISGTLGFSVPAPGPTDIHISNFIAPSGTTLVVPDSPTPQLTYNLTITTYTTAYTTVTTSKAPSTTPSDVSRTTTSIVAFGCGISLLALSIALMSLFVMRRARQQTTSQHEIDPFLIRERAYPQFVERSPQIRQGPPDVISNGKLHLVARQLPVSGHGSGGYSAVNSVSSPGVELASSRRPLTTQASEERSPQEHLPQLSRQGADLSRAQSLGGSTLAWFPRCGAEPPPRYKSQSSGR